MIATRLTEEWLQELFLECLEDKTNFRTYKDKEELLYDLAKGYINEDDIDLYTDGTMYLAIIY